MLARQATTEASAARTGTRLLLQNAWLTQLTKNAFLIGYKIFVNLQTLLTANCSDFEKVRTVFTYCMEEVDRQQKAC